MSDPTLQSLAADLQALTQKIDDFIRAAGGDINRLRELTQTFGPRIQSLEGGRFSGDRNFRREDVELLINPEEDYEGTTVVGDLDVNGRLDMIGGARVSNIAALDGPDGLVHLDVGQVRIHGSDLFLDGRSRQIDDTRFYRALVDMGDQLIVNFNGDYRQGVLVGSGMTVAGTVRAGNVEADSMAVNGTMTVSHIEASDGTGGILHLDVGQVRIHGGDLLLDGRSSQIDDTRHYRALVDMGDQLVINFNGDYHKGVFIHSDVVINDDLVVNDRVTANAVQVGKDGAPGIFWIENAAGEDAIRMFGESGNIHASKVRATLLPPGGDCAEQFEVAGGVAAEPGMVMIIGSDGLLLPCAAAHDTRLAGVISGAGDLRPGLILNERSDSDRAAVALIGTVYCRCDAGYGPVAPGDLLTTSPTPGHAMRAEPVQVIPGSIVGKALKGLPEGTGLVPIMVAPR